LVTKVTLVDVTFNPDTVNVPLVLIFVVGIVLSIIQLPFIELGWSVMLVVETVKPDSVNVPLLIIFEVDIVLSII
jgi:hypothetical protein